MSAFQPYTSLQNPVDDIEEGVLDVLQRNIHKVLYSSPSITVGQKRSRSNSITDSVEVPLAKVPSISNTEVVTLKNQIRHLNVQLDDAMAQVRMYKTSYEKNRGDQLSTKRIGDVSSASVQSGSIHDILSSQKDAKILELQRKINSLSQENSTLKASLEYSNSKNLMEKLKLAEETISSLEKSMETILSNGTQKKSVDLSQTFQQYTKSKRLEPFQANFDESEFEEIKVDLGISKSAEYLAEINQLRVKLQSQEAHSMRLENQLAIQMELEYQIQSLKHNVDIKNKLIAEQDAKIVDLEYVKEKMARWRKVLGKEIFKTVDDSELESFIVKQRDDLAIQTELAATRGDKLKDAEKKIEELNVQLNHKSQELEKFQLWKSSMESEEQNTRKLLDAYQQSGAPTSEAQERQIIHLSDQLSKATAIITKDEEKLDNLFTFNEMKVFCKQVFGWDIQLLESRKNYKKIKIAMHKNARKSVIIERENNELSSVVIQGISPEESIKHFQGLQEPKNCPELLRKLFVFIKRASKQTSAANPNPVPAKTNE